MKRSKDKRQQRYNRSDKGRYREGKRSAKNRGIKFDLTIAEYIWLVKKARCHYCSGTLPKAGFGLDRLENKKGYCSVNAVPCCRVCNMIKGDTLTAEEMRAVAKLLQSMRNISKGLLRKR